MTEAKRNVYLSTLPINEAVAKAKQTLDKDTMVCTETVASEAAYDRVLAKAVYARYSSPTFHSAAMDGIAVQASTTFLAREGHPLTLKKGQGYQPINTGNALPAGFNAVIMIEHVTELSEAEVSIEAPAFPWQHVRRIGEDIIATEQLFPRNHVLNAYDIGVLLTAGVWEIEVWEKLRIHIIPTGDEILDFTKRPEPKAGQFIESNSQVLANLAQQRNCTVTRIPPVSDTIEALTTAFDTALASNAHIIIVCAGSSAGSKDFTRTILESRGTVMVHGIAAMPGKPSLLAQCQNKLVVGAPGYPVSAVVCFEELVEPLIAWLSRHPLPPKHTVPVLMTRKIPSKLGVEEFCRLAVGKVEDTLVATPLARGAGNISTLARAQAVTRIPAHSEGIEEHSIALASLAVSMEALESFIVCVGSHDNLLDMLADELMGQDPAYRLISSHVGSMGGITALKNKACHIAGMHLFDPATGDFNHPFLQRYIPDADITLVNLAIRHQGLLVQKGNPKNITKITDLARPEVSFINRQRGAGTRILLDWHLEQANIKPHTVQGYQKEESTHMAVAVNVLTGAADCALGIYAAAKALDLDFIPLARERYDLAIPTHLLKDSALVSLLSILEQEAFKQRIREVGGYETQLTGKVMHIGMQLG